MPSLIGEQLSCLLCASLCGSQWRLNLQSVHSKRTARCVPVASASHVCCEEHWDCTRSFILKDISHFLHFGLQEETGLDSTLCTYRIEVQTSNFRGAGTTANAAATIYGPGGEAGGPPEGTAQHMSCLLQV